MRIISNENKNLQGVIFQRGKEVVHLRAPLVKIEIDYKLFDRAVKGMPPLRAEVQCIRRMECDGSKTMFQRSKFRNHYYGLGDLEMILAAVAHGESSCSQDRKLVFNSIRIRKI